MNGEHSLSMECYGLDHNTADNIYNQPVHSGDISLSMHDDGMLRS